MSRTNSTERFSSTRIRPDRRREHCGDCKSFYLSIRLKYSYLAESALQNTDNFHDIL